MRFIHDGFAALRIRDDEDRVLALDPWEEQECDVIALSGGPWAERYAGLDALLTSDKRPEVVAPEPLAGWLEQAYGVSVHIPPCSVSGFSFVALPYTPCEPSGGGVDRVRAALRRPRWAVDRLTARRRLPEAPPHAWRIELRHGHRFAHLGLALHSDTPSAWIARARTELLAEVDNVLAGYSHGESAAFIRHIVSLMPARLLITDQVADLRRAAGLPVQLITPTRDELVRSDCESHVFVSGTAMRFEQDDTVKR